MREEAEAAQKRAFESDDESNLPFIDDDDEDEAYLKSEAA